MLIKALYGSNFNQDRNKMQYHKEIQSHQGNYE